MNSPATGASVPMMGEETVVFRQGHLVQGVLDKNHYGASMNGLVHSCYEVSCTFTLNTLNTLDCRIILNTLYYVIVVVWRQSFQPAANQSSPTIYYVSEEPRLHDWSAGYPLRTSGLSSIYTHITLTK